MTNARVAVDVKPVLDGPVEGLESRIIREVVGQVPSVVLSSLKLDVYTSYDYTEVMVYCERPLTVKELEQQANNRKKAKALAKNIKQQKIDRDLIEYKRLKKLFEKE